MSSPILITGAGQRIGLALAEHFLAQGQEIIVTYRTRHEAINWHKRPQVDESTPPLIPNTSERECAAVSRLLRKLTRRVISAFTSIVGWTFISARMSARMVELLFFVVVVSVFYIMLWARFLLKT